MDWNETGRRWAPRSGVGGRRTAGVVTLGVALAALPILVGCSVSGPRESPVLGVTRGSPSVVDIYRAPGGSGRAADDAAAGQGLLSARERLDAQAYRRPVAPGDGDTQRYGSAVEPLRQRFARVPNPELVMVVFPHLAKGQYPVPGYVTVFPMYEQANLYALPGEVEQALHESRAVWGRAREGERGPEGRP
jgi:conjugative transfer region lipoprotein (TIGR03751 family)